MRTDLEHRTRQLQIRDVIGIQLPGRDRQSRVHAVAAAVGAYGVPLARVPDGAYDRTAHDGIGMAPRDGDGIDVERVGVRREVDVVERCELGGRDAVVIVRDALLLVGGGRGDDAHFSIVRMDGWMDGWMDGRYTCMLLLAFWFIGLMAVKEVGENELKDTVALPLPHIYYSL